MLKAKETQKTGHDSEKIALSIERIMQELAALMDEEVALLERQDVGGVGALREKKARLAREYQLSIESLARKPDMLREASPEARARLKQMGVKLETATQRNAVGLKAAIAATQALVQAVVSAARQAVKANDIYADPRKAPLKLGSYSPVSEPVAVRTTA